MNPFYLYILASYLITSMLIHSKSKNIALDGVDYILLALAPFSLPVILSIMILMTYKKH